MRAAARVASSPGDYHDWQQRQREEILRTLLAELRRADNHDEPWYEWLLARAERRHDHELRDPEGRPIACPYPGCTAVAGSRRRSRTAQSSSVQPHEERRPQLELVT